MNGGSGSDRKWGIGDSSMAAAVVVVTMVTSVIVVVVCGKKQW